MGRYLREAVRQYMSLQKFNDIQKRVAKRLKKKGLKAADVDSVVDALRKKS